MAKKEWTYLKPSHAELTNTSRCIHKGPCLVTGFSVCGAGGNAEADIYDGENANGNHKFRVFVLDDTTFSWPLSHPVDFDNGIYIKVKSDRTYVTICYIPESWKDFI